MSEINLKNISDQDLLVQLKHLVENRSGGKTPATFRQKFAAMYGKRHRVNVNSLTLKVGVGAMANIN
jgi:hypothetical protein